MFEAVVALRAKTAVNGQEKYLKVWTGLVGNIILEIIE
jgi:hypothetical protein